MANTYRTTQGDTWDIISLNAYGSEMQTGLLVQANQQHASTAIFSAGVVLQVPDLPATASDNANLPPWRRRA